MSLANTEVTPVSFSPGNAVVQPQEPLGCTANEYITVTAGRHACRARCSWSPATSRLPASVGRARPHAS